MIPRIERPGWPLTDALTQPLLIQAPSHSKYHKWLLASRTTASHRLGEGGCNRALESRIVTLLDDAQCYWVLIKDQNSWYWSRQAKARNRRPSEFEYQSSRWETRPKQIKTYWCVRRLSLKCKKWIATPVWHKSALWASRQNVIWFRLAKNHQSRFKFKICKLKQQVSHTVCISVKNERA